MIVLRPGSGVTILTKGCDSEVVGDALGVELKTARSHPMGCMKWCNRCSRFHRSRIECDLYARHRPTRGPKAKSNRLNERKLVKRWAH